MGRLRLRISDTRADRLPDACMACGEPSKEYVRKDFSWFPPWIYATIALGVLLALILTSVMTKRMRVDIPLCHEHFGHFRQRVVLYWVLIGIWMISPVVITVMIMGLIGAGVLGEGAGAAICPSIIVVFLAFLAVMVVSKFTAIPPEITDNSIT